MLMKAAFQGAGTDEEFRRKLTARKRVILAGVLMGALAFASGILMLFIMPDTKQNSFLAGVYCGVGTAAIVIGGRALYKMRKMLKDESLLRKERIKEGDERAAEIGKQATVSGVQIYLFAMLAGLLVSGFFSMQVFWTLWGTTLGLCLIIKGTEMYYKKKM